jgi:MFS family permease
VADALTQLPDDLLTPEETHARGALGLLRLPDFRRLFTAVSASEVGDAVNYVAVMWTALLTGGPIGIVVVRLCDSVPALVFGLHGGLVADRLDRKRVLIVADLARAAVLVPVAALALVGELPLWGLAAAAFALRTAESYFAPAYGALLPALVHRRNVQAANGLVRATADSIGTIGWAVAAALLLVIPVSVFFAVNAISFVVSALVIARIASPGRSRAEHDDGLELRGAFSALRPLPVLAAAFVVLGVAMTISEGTWMVGVPELVRSDLGAGVGTFSLIMSGWAVGSIIAGAVLARRAVRRKALVGMLAWTLQFPAYLLLGLAGSLPLAVLGAVGTGLAHGAASVLVTSAAQEQVPDRMLGRVMGLLGFIDRGAHATGLIFMGPLFAVLAPGPIFVAAAFALLVTGLAGASYAWLVSREGKAGVRAA